MQTQLLVVGNKLCLVYNEDDEVKVRVYQPKPAGALELQYTRTISYPLLSSTSIKVGLWVGREDGTICCFFAGKGARDVWY